MPTLARHLIVDAPADAVWEVVGHQFDRIGAWATAIRGPPRSRRPPRPRRPRFLKAARNHWRVEALDQRRTRISLHATVQPRGVLGWLPYLLLRVQLARVAAGFLQDLRYYVEHGRPSPRKQRQLDTSKR